METLRHQRELSKPPSSSARRATRQARAAKRSSPGQAGPRSPEVRRVRIGSERVAALAGECAAEPGPRRLGPGHRDRPGCALCRGSLAASRRLARALASLPIPAGRSPARSTQPRVDSSRASRRPADFTLTLRYGYRPRAFSFNFPDFFSAFVGLRLPIWAWRKQNRLADAARADSPGPRLGCATRSFSSAARSLRRCRVQASQQRLALLVDGVLPNARGTVESCCEATGRSRRIPDPVVVEERAIPCRAGSSRGRAELPGSTRHAAAATAGEIQP